MRTLDQLAAEGYVTDEWSTWQQGSCLEYAYALTEIDPTLCIAAIMDSEWGLPNHWFATDGTWAYDSAGRHPMPYVGVHPEVDPEAVCETDIAWPDYADLDEPMIPLAHEHIARHNTLRKRALGVPEEG